MVIKKVGSSGKISLGKRYAGCQVLIDEKEPGVWVVKLGDSVTRRLDEIFADEELAREQATKASELDEAGTDWNDERW